MKETRTSNRTPRQIALDIFNGKDEKAKTELEKMMGCKFEDMNIRQRRFGVAVLSVTEEYWNK